MRILVTGSRDWPDQQAVDDAICDVITERYRLKMPDPEHVVIVHGACPTGADYHAALTVQRLNQWFPDRIVVEQTYPADWDQYGKRAGFIRNSEMVNNGADICLAFIKDQSKGASMTAQLAKHKSIPIRRYEA